MKQYIGVKMVQAEPESRDGKEGFKVIYEEGYESWCPKEVFLDHNQKISRMPFSFALEAVKHGRKAARIGWNGKGMYIYLQPGSTINGKRDGRNAHLQQLDRDTITYRHEGGR
jgi:hypothetical protein